MQSEITQEQWTAYIYDLYFGAGTPLENCINRAYRDFNRTLHDFATQENGKSITDEAKKHLMREFEKLKTTPIKNQVDFDIWHQEQCLTIQAIYTKNNYQSFHIGQAQKWINMTFKYIFSYGEYDMPGYKNLYPFCHVPLDNILIQSLKDEGYSVPFQTCWSKISDYKTYLNVQKDFRNKFKDSHPLDTEFKLWNNARTKNS
ncbi:hypothetical protein [Sulfurospirillum oryzae]|uniref:hypothetical protein n=1 Tax=Sulfurospirillum oryzae TaxID=2976535 RepID=UPI0021E74685|nr:hypothetical protein [Sulfurospirillum oryzae]